MMNDGKSSGSTSYNSHRSGSAFSVDEVKEIEQDFGYVPFFLSSSSSTVQSKTKFVSKSKLN